MKARLVLSGLFVFALAPVLPAQTTVAQRGEAPPLIQGGLPAPALPGLPSAPQRVYGPSGDTLISRQTADGILEGFRKANKSDHAPRIVIYVNRALVDASTGFLLMQRDEKFETGESSTKTSGTNTYTLKEGKPPALADQQTVREIERLFGRAFRHAGAQLADQETAMALLPDQPGEHLIGNRAAKGREALGKIADIAIEVLISSRNVVVPRVSGDVTYPVPDIQATAIRLKDAAIVGQAAASDIIGKGLQAGRVVQQFDASDITEATAIALMEDMLIGAK